MAVAKSQINISFFDTYYATLSSCRDLVAEAIMLASQLKMVRPIPEQARIIRYCIEFLVTQAHRSVLWRCQASQIARSRVTEFGANGDTYTAKLQALKTRSENEAYQAFRRVLQMIKETLDEQNPYSMSELFLPGKSVPLISSIF